MTESDADAVLAIYAEGIATGEATFRPEAPTWVEFDSAHLSSPRLVACHGATEAPVAGWAALSPYSSSCGYAGVADVSVYVTCRSRGAGVGGCLLGALVAAAEEAGIWTVRACVFPENAASLAAHARAGFREVGRHERIGRMAHGPRTGTWRDVVVLERRSPRAGMD